MKNTIYYSLILIFASTSAIAQQKIGGFVLDKETRLPIPFATIVYNTSQSQHGVISDVNGRYIIPDKVDSVVVSCIGYSTKRLSISNLLISSNIELQPLNYNIKEVVVTPDMNPAIPIIRKVLSNKKQNNHLKYSEFTYKCYVKTTIDFRRGIDSIGVDTTEIGHVDKNFEKMAAFISESVIATSKYNNLFENKIIAQRTSGFKSSIIPVTFVSAFHHSISFYNNTVSLFEMSSAESKFESDYVSPLSDGCLSCYRFELESEYCTSSDSVFVINFKPKRGSSFSGLTGQLFVSSNGYAIKHIVVVPAEPSLLKFRFKQDYELVDGKWFPKRLDEEIGWRLSDTMNLYTAYVITSNIDSVNLNPKLKRSDIGIERVTVDEKSLKNSEQILAKSRIDTLNGRELYTYHVMDSLGQKLDFDRWLNLFPSLADGKFPLNYFDLDVLNLYSFNKFEGNRLGLGIFTNRKLMKNIRLGGFVAYGLKDEMVKYGCQLKIDFDRYYDVFLLLTYQDGLKEVGRGIVNDFSNRSVYYYGRDYLGSRFDRCNEVKAEFGTRFFRNLEVLVSLAARDLNQTYAYRFKGDSLSSYNADYLRVTLQYAHGESLITYSDIRRQQNDGNPIIGFTYERAVDFFYRNSFAYNRFESTIAFYLYGGRIGQSNFLLKAGYIDSSVPHTLLFTGEGCFNKDLPYAIKSSFQTMSPYEFLSNKYVSLFYSHNFGTLLINTKHFKPQFEVVQNSGWGELAHADDHSNIIFDKKNRIYLESGIVAKNIFRFNCRNALYIGFGVGVYFRYGYYAHSNNYENLSLKMSVVASLK